jgi:N6-adenosine-specific RNA methylase IME4
MMEIDLKNHPAADRFPMMDDDRYAELRDGMRENGFTKNNPVKLFEGKILDGRNRYKAAVELGIEAHFEPVTGNPFKIAWALNGQRRDLAADQRAVIAQLLEFHANEYDAISFSVTANANKKRAEALAARDRKDDGTMASSPVTTCDDTGRDHAAEADGRSSTAKAKASGTNRGAVDRASKLIREAPHLAEKVAHGEMKSTQAHRMLRKAKIANRTEPFPDGKFRVLYADPPWQYSDSREGLGAGDGAGKSVDRASTAASDHYPTMSKADLKALDVKSLADEDAVLFCWATFPLLADQLEVIEAWGFKYKTAFVWDKTRGSFGHYHNCEDELLLVCTRGSCTPDSDKKEKQGHKLKASRHSAKPEAFRQMIDRMYPHGPRIELFCRGMVPDGWFAWGNEVEPTVEAAA